MKQANSDVLERFRTLIRQARQTVQESKEPGKPHIYIGMATCGLAAGATETKQAFEETLAERGIEARIIPVGCIGHCYGEPLVVIENPGFPAICYHKVTAGKAGALVRAFLEEGDPLFEYVLGALEENDLIPTVMDFPRFNLERRVVMADCGALDPENIDQYLAGGGYESLLKALEMTPEEVIQEIIDSGLRGRGGAGFPTGRKWQAARSADGSRKTVICNADEGDPGAYMDRTILESNPHQLLEGLAVCAYAVEAENAVIYVRAEYPLAVKMIRRAIDQAGQAGLLGAHILGTRFSLSVSVFEGSGAFVCGEETALIQSLEGKRGMPQHRPPYPVHKGLWQQPTVINNVKTLSSVPTIVKKGAAWYRQIGTQSSPGTAIFSVVGKVVHPGLVEIPMGTTLGRLIFEICGGIPNRKKFKAVQIGGPSGGCLPESFMDTPVDFDSLTQAGAMMGSGGMVVMDEDSCLVNVARFFIDFTQNESCGKCTFCRIGTRHILNILERITKGEGKEGDLETLRELSQDIKTASLCGLGKTAPNPILTSLEYFREEYQAHIREKRCPAMMCRALTAFYIDLDKCARGCDACVGSCPVDAIFTTKGRKKAIDQELCVKCGECMVACPTEYDAVGKVSPSELAPVIERPQEKAS
ncbi:NADH-quinone oxidoreductase subunit NuoF [Desulfoferrobacter suflitae]|uniref:NADH-quinone oxidoreductase subunit NuoF n=1 Tax=Desulfoferrobacter suflitae TaxID=2865782 RepID=UPI002164A883|nr:NADH-quinone oxidoreductase subunit NuoF [Desulfoferrobacter suflitae]MCK8600748.1 NADH-quinone oxidoreductase subunit NuoF [Desulfoferrobacter suflitae]